MDVTPQRLKEELDKGTAFLLVDLQETEKYQHAHIPGAVNIPMASFAEQYPAVLKDKAMSPGFDSRFFSSESLKKSNISKFFKSLEEDLNLPPRKYGGGFDDDAPF